MPRSLECPKEKAELVPVPVLKQVWNGSAKSSFILSSELLPFQIMNQVICQMSVKQEWHYRSLKGLY